MRFLLALPLLLCLCCSPAPVWGADAGTPAVVVKAPAKASAKNAEASDKAKQSADKASQPAKAIPKASLKTKSVPRADSQTMGQSMGAGSWYLDGAPRKARGSLWEQGVEGASLSKDRTEMGKAKRQAEARRQETAGPASKHGVDTQKGINSALNEISAYERQAADGSALGLNKPGGPSFQVTKDKSSWRNEASGPGTVGQDVMTTRRNVVGAYADVVNDDDLRVSVGPELHIPDTETTSNHIAPQHPESSTLGVGMKWQWDF